MGLGELQSQNRCLVSLERGLGIDLTAESESGAGGGSGWLRSFCSCIQGSRASNDGDGCLLKKMHNLRVVSYVLFGAK